MLMSLTPHPTWTSSLSSSCRWRPWLQPTVPPCTWKVVAQVPCIVDVHITKFFGLLTFTSCQPFRNQTYGSSDTCLVHDPWKICFAEIPLIGKKYGASFPLMQEIHIIWHISLQISRIECIHAASSFLFLVRYTSPSGDVGFLFLMILKPNKSPWPWA